MESGPSMEVEPFVSWATGPALFSWCEPDYESASFVAEPHNTVSNTACVVGPVPRLGLPTSHADHPTPPGAGTS